MQVEVVSCGGNWGIIQRRGLGVEALSPGNSGFLCWGPGSESGAQTELETKCRSGSNCKTLCRDFPGGVVVKTPHSQCRGPGFSPLSGN